MKNFTIEQIRSLIREKLEWNTRLDDDNDIDIRFTNSDWPCDMQVYVSLKEGKHLKVSIHPVGYQVAASDRAKVMVAINKMNFDYNYITGMVTEDGNLLFFRRTLLDEDVSEEYVVINEIQLPVLSADKYFQELLKL